MSMIHTIGVLTAKTFPTFIFLLFSDTFIETFLKSYRISDLSAKYYFYDNTMTFKIHLT